MVNILIKIGDCGCPHWYRLPHLCWKDKKVYLVAEKQHYKIVIDKIESCLNHEVIHLVIDKFEGERISKRFDKIFDKTKKVVVREDGTPT